MFFLTRNPPEDPIQWLALILTTVRNVLGEHIRKDGSNAALLDYAFGRLLRMLHAFNALVRRAMAGDVTVRQPRRAVAEDSASQPATRKPRAKPAFWLPRQRGWMLRAVVVMRHLLPAAAADLRALCADPMMAPWLEKYPALRRMLRSLYAKLMPDAYPPQLRRPHEPEVIAPRLQCVKLPSHKEFLRALRAGTPYKGLVFAYNRVMTSEEFLLLRKMELAKTC